MLTFSLTAADALYRRLSGADDRGFRPEKRFYILGSDQRNEFGGKLMGRKSA
jgi:hypothetical protein